MNLRGVDVHKLYVSLTPRKATIVSSSYKINSIRTSVGKGRWLPLEHTTWIPSKDLSFMMQDLLRISSLNPLIRYEVMITFI